MWLSYSVRFAIKVLEESPNKHIPARRLRRGSGSIGGLRPIDGTIWYASCWMVVKVMTTHELVESTSVHSSSRFSAYLVASITTIARARAVIPSLTSASDRSVRRRIELIDFLGVEQPDSLKPLFICSGPYGCENVQKIQLVL
ncbi:hypothetical protein K504DRAFT_497332 [Pleomassaria siparia CBS 279.74]|uniref:Uncharacterized protein n=1 Tax=Pleomassaria siparia CBS 279.74 TaxID=1314801 RepID=A0A6G1KRJ2_9PLEO|nr:hypothetical protein K504DRAFT_497332 [Pleomassaria siparia CBS 279.74]